MMLARVPIQRTAHRNVYRTIETIRGVLINNPSLSVIYDTV